MIYSIIVAKYGAYVNIYNFYLLVSINQSKQFTLQRSLFIVRIYFPV